MNPNLLTTKLTDDELIASIKSGMTQAAIAKEFGLNKRTVERKVARLAKKGFSPAHDMTRVVPDGYKVKGVSTLYNKDGQISAQWVKSSEDRERQLQMMQAAVDALREEIKPTAPVGLRHDGDGDLLNVFVITDYHLGMLAWSEETGSDWDLGIAEDLLVSWFAEAIRRAPKASKAVFAQLGDFHHFDSLDAVTPTNRHLLDSDTRFQKLIRVAIRSIRRIIAMLLEHFQEVSVLMAEGNHDLARSAWLRELLAALYDNEPRVEVETSPVPYYCIEHGDTALFFHHGHLKRMDQVDTVFAGMFREVFGRTKHAYAHTGHLHHNVVKETNLMQVEQHRTLAAPDAYASRHGWLSGRDAKVITYHVNYGEVGRVVVSPHMVWGNA